MSKSTYVIDGNHFATLEEFYDEISRVLIPGASWGRNLDAFNDILRGGFGTPDDGFMLLWTNFEVSRRQLGYPETVKQLEKHLARCHPSGRQDLIDQLNQARQRMGPTVCDWLVEIIRRHGGDGEEAEDGVELVLEQN